MLTTSYKGVVRGKTVILDEDADLPEGTGVMVTPMSPPKGSPQAILEVLKSFTPASHEAAEELRRHIREGKRPAIRARRTAPRCDGSSNAPR